MFAAASLDSMNQQKKEYKSFYEIKALAPQQAETLELLCDSLPEKFENKKNQGLNEKEAYLDTLHEAMDFYSKKLSPTMRDLANCKKENFRKELKPIARRFITVLKNQRPSAVRTELDDVITDYLNKIFPKNYLLARDQFGIKLELK